MNLGPLWTHSCFCFEDFNGELRSLFHGTQSIEEQIVLAISVQQKIPELLGLYLKMVQSLKRFMSTCPGNDNLFSRKKSFGMTACIALWVISEIIFLLTLNDWS